MKKTFLVGWIILGSHFLYGQVNVDPSTGRLQANIPLLTITQGSISAPVSLVYQGGGIKVEQGEGSAGMGWDLSAGGGVYRELRGLPDDVSESTGSQRQGWLASGVASAIQSFTPQTDDNPSVCSDERPDYQTINGRYYKYDTEPDIFSFGAPGLSGQFVFDGSGNPKPMPYQDISITPGFTGSAITSFTIKTNLGVTYVFSAVETVTRAAINGTNPSQFALTYSQFQNALTFTTAWRLTSITSAVGDQINLTYTSKDTEHSQTEISIVNPSGTETKLYDIQEDVNTKQLATITSTLQTASFEWTDNRITALTETRASSAKNFVFEYVSAYDQAASPANHVFQKSFLMKVTELHDCISFPSYEFEYDGLVTLDGGQSWFISLGFADRKMQDLWGYFNGTSSNNIPNIYYNSSATDGERFRAIPIASELPYLTGASRFANDSFVSRGSLETVKFPQGGTQIIYYESNQYYDAAAGASKKGGGARVSSIRMSGAARGSSDIITNYEYLAANGQSSGTLSYPPSFAFPDGTNIIRTTRHMGPESYVMYGRTTVKQTGKGKTVYTFLVPGMYPSTTSGADWSATRSKVARDVPAQVPGDPPVTCPPLGNLVNGYYAFPWAVNQNFDHERGLIQYLTQYDESGLKLSETEYTYQQLTTGQVTVKGLKYEAVPGAYVFGSYSLVANVGKVVRTEKVRTTDELTPGGTLETPANFIKNETTYTYNSTHKLLEQVDATNSDGIRYNTKYKYAKDFASITNPEPTDTAAVAIKALNDARRHATVIQTTRSSIGATIDVVDASLMIYGNFGGKTLPYKTLSYPKKPGYTEATVTTNGSGKHIFNYNTDHLGTRILSYGGALPAGAKDYRNKKSGVHYGYSNTIPVAVITNALPEEVVYDGFETSTGYEFPSTTIVSGNAFAGFNMGNWSTAGYFKTKDNIKKGSTKYKASVWVYSATATTITFKVLGNSSVLDQKSVNYTSSDVNKWKYVEAFLDVTTFLNVISFQLQSSAPAYVDEVLFHPREAQVTMMSHHTMFGKIAEVDESGNAAFTIYDALGRPKYLQNKDRDVLQYNEYKYESQPVVPVNSSFSVDQSEYNFKTGTVLNFAAQGGNCLPVTTYQWKVNGASIGTNSSTAQYTFPGVGPATVELGVTLSNGTYSKSTAVYCVTPSTLNYGIAIENFDGGAETETSECHHLKTFSLEPAGAVYNGCGNPLTYAWYYKADSQSIWTPIGTDDEVIVNEKVAYTVKCVISQSCPALYPCASMANNVQEVTQHISFVIDNHCQ